MPGDGTVGDSGIEGAAGEFTPSELLASSAGVAGTVSGSSGT